MELLLLEVAAVVEDVRTLLNLDQLLVELAVEEVADTLELLELQILEVVVEVVEELVLVLVWVVPVSSSSLTPRHKYLKNHNGF